MVQRLRRFLARHKRGEEAAAEAVALDLLWTFLRYAGLFGAGVATAAVASTVTSTGVVHLSPGKPLVNYVFQAAPRYHVDPAAELAITTMEGAGGGIGDNGTSFGPNQLHAGGALPRSVYYGPFSEKTQEWAWSSTGVNYVLHQEEELCGGLVGYRAVSCIAYRFERSTNPARETAGAWAHYYLFHPVKHRKLTRAQRLRRRHGFHAWFDWTLGVGKWKGIRPFNHRYRPHTRLPVPHRWWERRAAYVRRHR